MIAISLSGAAILISALSLACTFYFNRMNLKTSAPKLTFSSDGGEWKLKNIGKSAAVEVVVFDGDDNDWRRAVRCYDLAAGELQRIHWAPGPTRLAVRYESPLGQSTATYCERDTNEYGITSKIPITKMFEVQLEREQSSFATK